MKWSLESARDKKTMLMGGGFLLLAVVSTEIVTGLSTSGLSGNLLWITYCALLFAFVVASVTVIKPDVSNLTYWWTFMVLLQFGLAPIVCVLLELDVVDIYSLKSLGFVFAGMVGFWIGARMLQKNAITSSFVLADESGRRRRVNFGIAMAVLGGICKIYMIRAGLYFYNADVAQVEASGRYREWLFVLASFTTYSLVVLGIEHFHRRQDKLVRNVFYATIAVSIAFALLSGMKGEVLVIPFLLLIVKKLVGGSMDWKLAGGMALLLVVIFPINAAFRSQIHSEGSFTSLEVGSTAVRRAVRSVNEDSLSNVMLDSVANAADRLNLLQVIVFLEQDEGRSDIGGDERLWMIPFYPFVPRFLWAGKPVLDKGMRLSVAMGSTSTSSVAVTPFGDLFLLGGLTAVVLGMVCVGMMIQSISNMVVGDFGPKAVLIYVILFSRLYAPEYDLMMLGTTTIQTLVIAYLIGDMVYGGKIFRYRSQAVSRTFAKHRGPARLFS